MVMHKAFEYLIVSPEIFDAISQTIPGYIGAPNIVIPFKHEEKTYSLILNKSTGVGDSNSYASISRTEKD